MNWLVFTIIAITARSSYSIAAKVLSNDVRVSPITQSLLLTSSAGMLSLLFSPFLGGISFNGIGQYGLAAVLMIASQGFANILFYKGVQELDAGTTQIAFSSILIWGALLSVMFLGSSFSFTQVMGLALMFIAILIVQYKGRKVGISSSVSYIILSAVLFAIFQVASADLAEELTPATYLAMAYFGPTILIGGLYFRTVKNDSKKLTQQLMNTATKSLFVSGTSLLYFVCSFLAYSKAPDSGVVVVLLTSQVILSVVFGIIFLKERDNMNRKLLAGILAVIAGVLIKA